MDYEIKTLEAREHNANYRNLMLFCLIYNVNRDPTKTWAISPEDFLGKDDDEDPGDWKLIKAYLDTLIAQQERKKKKRRG